MSSVANELPSSPAVVVTEPKVPWTSVGWFAGLLLLCYAPVLIRLVQQWENDEDMGHGFFVPVIAG